MLVVVPLSIRAKDDKQLMLPAVQKFLIAFFKVYYKFQSIDNSSADFLFDCSQKFRLNLKEMIADLDKCVEAAYKLNIDFDFIEKDYDIIDDIHQLWHFCEIFLFSPPATTCIDEVLGWLQNFVDSIDPILVEQFDRRVSGSVAPEEIESNGDEGYGFWDTVTRLCLRGRLADAWSILSLHSVLISFTRPGNVGGVRAREYRDLEKIFLTYPRIGGNDERATVVTGWHDSVAALYNSGSSLVASVPELTALLRVLLGDAKALYSFQNLVPCVRNGTWTSLALSKLLFFSSQPMSRAGLVSFLRKTIAEGRRENEQERDALFADVVQGDAGTLVSWLFRQTFAADMGTSSPFSKLLRTVCTAHLLTLITAADSDIAGFRVPGEETGLLAAAMLQLAEALASSVVELPLCVLETYLAACPVNQRTAVAAALLTRRPFLHASDDNSVEVADCLGRLGLFADAAAVDVARGHWWRTRLNFPKALYFFLRAQRFGSVFSAALLEDCFDGCVRAVMAAPMFRGGLFVLAVPLGVTEISDKSLLDALVCAKELQMAGPVQTVCWGRWLQSYVAAVEMLLGVLKGTSAAEACVEAFCGLLPSLPVRYWGHVIDVVTWLDRFVSEAKAKTSIISLTRVTSLMALFETVLSTACAASSAVAMKSIRERLFKCFVAATIAENIYRGERLKTAQNCPGDGKVASSKCCDLSLHLLRAPGPSC